MDIVNGASQSMHADKTVTMTFKQGSRIDANDFYYNDEILKKKKLVNLPIQV